MDKEKQIVTQIIEEYKNNELVYKKESKYFVPKDEQITNDTLIVAWELSEKDSPFVGVFEKKEDHLYVEHTSNKNEGYFALKGYRKQGDTVREVLQKMLGKMYKLTGCGVPYNVKKFIEEIADEYGVNWEDL